jgi:hypothetical protein
MDWVLPGVLEVLASFFWLASALIKVDLPELDLPQRAISLPESEGKSLLSVAAQAKVRGKGFDL